MLMSIPQYIISDFQGTVNDSLKILTEYFWKFQYTIA